MIYTPIEKLVVASMEEMAVTAKGQAPFHLAITGTLTYGPERFVSVNYRMATKTDNKGVATLLRFLADELESAP